MNHIVDGFGCDFTEAPWRCTGIVPQNEGRPERWHQERVAGEYREGRQGFEEELACFPMAGYRRMFEALQHPGTPTQVASRVLKIVNKLWDDRAVSREK